MKHQLNDIPMKDKIPVVVLSSFIIGLLLTPLVYIVIIGVLGGGGDFRWHSPYFSPHYLAVCCFW